FARNNRVYNYNSSITVPFSNKELNVEFETFRSKLLPGQKEEWKIKIKDKKGDKAVAEMLASMYDASLDAFVPHQWYFNIYPTYYSTINWETNQFINDRSSFFVSKNWNKFYPNPYKVYEKLNWFDYDATRGIRFDKAYSAAPNAAPQEALMKGESIQTNNDMADTDEKKEKSKNEPDDKTEKKSSPAIIPRKNLSETAFFFPQLQTDENGSLVIKFTAPEALTRWNFMGLAYTKDLKYAQIKKEIVTQKELMVTPHTPRFFREGDKITFTSKIDNLSPAAMNGSAQLFLYDAISMKDITAQFLTDNKKASQAFSASSKQAANIRWDLIIPEGMAAVSCKVIASAGNFSDGEEFIIPILTNRMLVTESLPVSVRSKQTKTLKFEKLISQNNNSTTLRNHKLTLEFCANPAWYAVQALPYIMEYPYECAEQIFSRFYANSIASHVANSSQKIKAVFDSWKQSTSEAFYSNLEKNQELKSLLLNETPWVLDAQDESERKKRVGLLFDFNKMSNELSTALSKLVKMQSSNGGWPWFAGMPEDRYITQHIVTGMGHLDHLGIKNIREDAMTWDMIKNALFYLDNRIGEDYEHIVKIDKKNIDKDHLGQLQIQYLYARSYFKDIPIDKENQPAFNYYKGQAQKYWLAKGRYMSGMIALSLNRFDDKKTPATIIKSLKENALYSEEMGMYWKESYEGFYWYEAPIECHALLIEAFDEVANDKKSVDELRIWLLKSKQTQNWKSTKATTEAVYALLLKGTEWLSTESNTEITLGNVKIDPQSNPDTKIEAGTGYFKQSWSGNDIKPTMGNITVNKKDEGISWGALYWQYFEQLDKITPHATPLQLTKKLFIEKNSSSGPLLETINDNYVLMPGDKIKVRIELRVDRSMEYVHMKDMRASGFEPVNVLSQYKWQDGLGYYESTGDAATNFFFSYLPKGTYVFEYPLVVSHTGDFSNGISSIQCMYAPEFTSHSEGIRVKVGK
ncbi:MAG TPA: alpha-2-macroglobulin family protein, partial [Bacteroidia bacterium]|nr:alpha-2-macroglobulin family protein [Bacteroidia bacterium]